MNARLHDGSDRTRGIALQRREFRAYAWGVTLALVLTLIPFAVVRWHALALPYVYYLIGVLALAQMVVHFRGFLHIGLHHQREDLLLILFSTLLLIIIVGGTLWIMINLAARMVLPSYP